MNARIDVHDALLGLHGAGERPLPRRRRPGALYRFEPAGLAEPAGGRLATLAARVVAAAVVVAVALAGIGAVAGADEPGPRIAATRIA